MTPANPSNDPVVHTTRETFQADAIERSREALVVLDFWAPWCGPCRMLGPVLEKLAAEFQGRFVLVKANTDEVPEAAAQFNVSGIPVVYALRDGQVIDFFQGALPESMVREWLGRVFWVSDLHATRKLEEQSPGRAEAAYRKMIAERPQDPDVKLGLARALIAGNRNEEAQAVIDELENYGMLDAEGRKIKASLALQQPVEVDLPALRRRAAADSDNLELQFELAEALARGGQHEPALESLLGIIERDKKGVGQRARELMLQIFQALPDDSELTPVYRRRLSLLLF